jgi:hypothetical protein
MKPEFKKRLEEVKKFLRKQKFVRFAYLFGSHAHGKEGKLSDVDFAFYLDKKLSKAERHKKELFLIGEICGIMGTDHVDVVIMNDVGYELNFEIIVGIPIFQRESRTDLEQRIISEYLDRRYYDKRYYDTLLDKIIKGGLLWNSKTK